MAETILVAEAGRPSGSSAARRLAATTVGSRRWCTGRARPHPVSVAARELRAALSTDAGLNAVLSLHVDGKKFLTMARELQRHPVLWQRDARRLPGRRTQPRGQRGRHDHTHRRGSRAPPADGVPTARCSRSTIRSVAPPYYPRSPRGRQSLISSSGPAVRVSDIALPQRDRRSRPRVRSVARGQPPRVQTVEEAPSEAEGVEGEAPKARRVPPAPQTRRPPGRVGRGELTTARACCPASGRGAAARLLVGGPRQPGSGIRADPSQPRAPRSSSCWRRVGVNGSDPKRELEPSWR